ncbi:hypothetical protein EGR_10062 [Echinococcus granulosus]|uniref:Uncharacterized protein n=1 Tax=Echinococcus granulosus TaxID=6210 RepID=W6U1W3_ECHGR|nr:hypothetical protein EGR_10062 [Echinococcus granulosus]EUB55095.1 hypothetical protein EGR_10062 [Echinococcus granulosus]
MGAKACSEGDYYSTDALVAADFALPTHLHDHTITTTSTVLLSAASPLDADHCELMWSTRANFPDEALPSR